MLDPQCTLLLCGPLAVLLPAAQPVGSGTRSDPQGAGRPGRRLEPRRYPDFMQGYEDSPDPTFVGARLPRAMPRCCSGISSDPIKAKMGMLPLQRPRYTHARRELRHRSGPVPSGSHEGCRRRGERGSFTCCSGTHRKAGRSFTTTRVESGSPQINADGRGLPFFLSVFICVHPWRKCF